MTRLRENPVFAGLNDDELSALIESFRVREFGRDEMLLKTGRRQQRSLCNSQWACAYLEVQPIRR